MSSIEAPAPFAALLIASPPGNRILGRICVLLALMAAYNPRGWLGEQRRKACHALCLHGSPLQKPVEPARYFDPVMLL